MPPSAIEKAAESLTEPLPASHELGVDVRHHVRFHWREDRGKPDDKIVRDALRGLGLTVWTLPDDPGPFFSPVYDSTVSFWGEIQAEHPGISVRNVLEVAVQLGATHGVVDAHEFPAFTDFGKAASEKLQGAGDTAQDVGEWFEKYGPWILGLTALAAAGALVGWFVIRPALKKG